LSAPDSIQGALAAVIMRIAHEEGVYGPHLALFEAVGRVAPSVLGKPLPLNGAGVCGAALADLGLPLEPQRRPQHRLQELTMSESPNDEPIDAEVVEETNAVAIPMTAPTMDYTEQGVPNFDYVRDKIEGRFATSVGAAELAKDVPQAASLDDQFTAREQAGRDRLEQIRRAIREE
jgi:hypothetical protein